MTTNQNSRREVGTVFLKPATGRTPPCTILVVQAKTTLHSSTTASNRQRGKKTIQLMKESHLDLRLSFHLSHHKTRATSPRVWTRPRLAWYQSLGVNCARCPPLLKGLCQRLRYRRKAKPQPNNSLEATGNGVLGADRRFVPSCTNKTLK